MTRKVNNMPPCGTETLDIGPGLIQVLLQALTIVALAVGLNRNHQAVTAGVQQLQTSITNGAPVLPDKEVK